MSKVALWRKKMDDYYKDITPGKLIHDLEECGFITSSKSNEERIYALRVLNEGHAEVAAGAQFIENRELLQDDSVDAVAVIIG